MDADRHGHQLGVVQFSIRHKRDHWRRKAESVNYVPFHSSSGPTCHQTANATRDHKSKANNKFEIYLTQIQNFKPQSAHRHQHHHHNLNNRHHHHHLPTSHDSHFITCLGDRVTTWLVIKKKKKPRWKDYSLSSSQFKRRRKKKERKMSMFDWL